MKEIREENRILYFDCLRILGALAVILLHVTAEEWNVAALWCWDRRILDIYSCATVWCVNIFLMISGALFLDSSKPLNLKKLYTKNIFRLVTAFVFWSAFYALGKLQSGHGSHDVLRAFLSGHFHLWYLIAAISLYIMIPVFRKLTESEKVLELYFVICFVWAMLFPGVITVMRLFSGELVNTIADSMQYWQDKSNFSFPNTCCFYFLLGYYLHKRSIGNKMTNGLIIAGAVSYVFRVAANEICIYTTGVDSVPIDFAALTAFLSIGVFLFAKQYCQKDQFEKLIKKIGKVRKPGKYIYIISDHTFGIYLVHMAVLYWLRARFDFLSQKPIWAVPVLTIAVFFGSFCITWIIRQVPLLKKYVV